MGDIVAPLGTLVKSMLCMPVVSSLMNTMVVPAATVMALGSKFRSGLEPAPAGMRTPTVAPELLVEVVALVVMVEVDVIVVVALVVVGDVVVVVTSVVEVEV